MTITTAISTAISTARADAILREEGEYYGREERAYERLLEEREEWYEYECECDRMQGDIDDLRAKIDAGTATDEDIYVYYDLRHDLRLIRANGCL